MLTAKAQSGYTLVGSARASAQSDCYQLTADRTAQIGAVWYDKPLELSKSFELEFTMNFGNNPLGADGIVMVMQTAGNRVIGTTGSGIGFQGLKPSLGIEFDTHANPNLGDLSADHIAIIRDGVSDHRLNTEFAPPVPISTSTNNVKDGKDYIIKVKWNAVSYLLQVQVNCLLRINQVVDLKNDIFKGFREAYWGFTSSTGSSANIHTVCLQKDIVVRDTFQVCKLESLTLVSNVSSDNKYTWQPATGLSNPLSRTPQLTATSSQLYTVSYLDRCSELKTDSVFVKVKTPDVTLESTKEACENVRIDLNPTLTPANESVKYLWSTGDTTRQLSPKTSGLYILTVTKDGCTASDSSTVTFHPLPKLGLQSEPTYDCPQSQPLRLDPQATGTNLTYTWTPGDTHEATLGVIVAGRYTVNIKTNFGCEANQSFTVLDNCSPAASVFVPNAFTPNGDGKNELFDWKSNTEVEVRMQISNRWGEVVFFTTNAREFWDGSKNGQPCPTNIYTWQLEYRSLQNNDWLVKRGEVLLIR
ncbi:lectin-like domain-containing protein [Spirosoma sp. KNUC1025]|uniref:lectin-like domain-containing protein n=1 Tax=Spirosoma sp. KNUC1025 TaxID=2894082 RepID=UPI00386D81A2|nr:gliding motility-associated C-terminal domain-containing protein [Spirosoma sp. KNUC1025]